VLEPLGPSALARVVVPAVVVDFLVYVVVLNLFVQLVPEVITESFTVSLLTAALLLLVLELVVRVKAPVKSRFRTASTALGRGASALLLWLVLVASKFVVLEVVNVVLGDRVSLGGFISVTALILVLMISRALVRRQLPQA
jgi:hypothetical protein